MSSAWAIAAPSVILMVDMRFDDRCEALQPVVKHHCATVDAGGGCRMPCEAAANVTWTAPQEGRVFRRHICIGKLRNDPGKIRRWYHRIKRHRIEFPWSQTSAKLKQQTCAFVVLCHDFLGFWSSAGIRSMRALAHDGNQHAATSGDVRVGRQIIVRMQFHPDEVCEQ